ncbi:MAG: RluA family pseudouridine synthase [Coriobacteriales bacterium]|jgi:23S rRNA pseudouridine1911/1915/1917 synthase|nr:RluA family pseudouridine synthase [Coriobacteriales bacterium]
MALLEHIVTGLEQGMRLDALLAELPDVPSRAAAVRLLESGSVSLNGETTAAKRRIVMSGDLIAYRAHEQVPFLVRGEQIPLDIRYEDEHLIVLSKPAGMVVHPAQGHASGTLVNALIARYGLDNLAQLQGPDRPGIVHRLDKGSSGLMLAAKSDQAGELLQQDIRTRNVDRRYLSLVHGVIAPESGLIDAPIARGDVDRKRMFASDKPFARAAFTSFKVLERFEAAPGDEGFTYLECKLHTGRTHQIRVHMSYIKHPIIGDPLYGRQNPKAQRGLRRQFLHSWSLAFTHPITEAPLCFTDNLPDDLAQTLSELAPRSLGRVAEGA